MTAGSCSDSAPKWKDASPSATPGCWAKTLAATRWFCNSRHRARRSPRVSSPAPHGNQSSRSIRAHFPCGPSSGLGRPAREPRRRVGRGRSDPVGRSRRRNLPRPPGRKLMDALTRAAIAGTSRETLPASVLPTDDLFEGAAGKNPERDLLLRAGMRVVYQAAGRVAESGVEVPRPVPEETLPACTARAAGLVRDLLMRPYDPQDKINRSLLREALERLQCAGLRLPVDLLPVALDGNRPRKLLLPVLFERVRRREPARAREWLADVWHQEKAEARREMVARLRAGLSGDDESFLESALDDRSKGVRTTAASLLSRLPASAYVGRAVVRADSIIRAYKRPSGFNLFNRARMGELIVEPPSVEDEGWKRDLRGGEVLRSQDSLRRWVGEKAERIMQALSVVPPQHWEEKFSVEPVDLISAAAGNDWEAVMLAGWCQAAKRHEDRNWALPLWKRCYEIPEEPEEQGIAWSTARGLEPLLPQATITKALRDLRRNEDMPKRLAQALGRVPPPWDEALSTSYREVLEKRLRTLSFATSEDPYMWWATLRDAATHFPTSQLESLDVTLPEEIQAEHNPTLLANWRRELEKFEETLELRRKLVKEIPL